MRNVAGKARRTFAGSSPEHKLYVTNFGERWRELRVVACDGVFRFAISASSRTPAYIYRSRV
jgi:hypothetical protein